jgi:hypothetical protein
MRDPHVVALRYRLESPESVVFEDAPAVERETAGFRLHLWNGKLTVHMKGHHATVESARVCVDPYLRAWEISTGLQFGSGQVAFIYDPPADMIDRDPPPPGNVRLIAGVANLTLKGMPCVVTVTRRSYPEPPDDFSASPDVRCMWLRYKMHKDGKEPLLSMAFFCLTLLQGATGKPERRALCDMYGIDLAVRDTLGEIVSERGGPEEARKFDVGTTRTPLTPKEQTWVDEVIRTLIQRKAQYDADPAATRPQITMSQFAPL